MGKEESGSDGRETPGKEIDLTRAVCAYTMEREGGRLLAFFPCQRCPGAGELTNPRCLAGALRCVEREPIVDGVVLSGYRESIYQERSMELLRRMAFLLSEMERLRGEAPGWMKGRGRCSRCEISPDAILGEAARLLFLDPGGMLDVMRSPILERRFGLPPDAGECRTCARETRDALAYLLSIALDVVGLLDEKDGDVYLKPARASGGKRGPLAIKRHPRIGEIIARTRDIDVETMGEKMERLLNIYRRVRPVFSTTWIDPEPPEGLRPVSGRRKNGAWIRLYAPPGGLQGIYHVLPSEYEMARRDIRFIQGAREEMLSSGVEGYDVSSHEMGRGYVKRRGREILLRILRETKSGSFVELKSRAERFADILERYTTGLGVLEFLLTDERVQDVYVDAPCGDNRVHLTISTGIPDMPGKMVTNIMLTDHDMESLVSRLRSITGRPFSESNPVLEADLHRYNARVTVIGPPLSPRGIAAAFRKHSTEPWTLPRLVANRTLSPLAAGLLWFLVDGQATIIVAGSRGAGKSSLLSALMFALPPSQRILTIEDTLELPVESMQKLGYKAQSMLVGTGQDSRDALRVSLRLGEGALVLGEVRSEEARVLYEAMRTGTAGSSVMGTFHADSPRAVYERVVHDLGIPFQSFSATDIIVISGLVRPGGGHRVRRRVVEIAEVDKENEGEFITLMRYSPEEDGLVATDEMYYRSLVIARIARSWGVSLEEALRGIEVRGRVHEMMASAANAGTEGVLNAEGTSKAYGRFWELLETGHRLDDVEGFVSRWSDVLESMGKGEE
ncbi:MAG: type II/IV secretion system ATPase subunit, partial [Thermoplasmata archaeon]|nr:type II/IV secretion system ATPase subunit [Thermoplasmata archaeon]